MTQVRALTRIFAEGVLHDAGSVFDYPDALAKLLKGTPDEGMEVVSKKNTAAFDKATAEAQKALEDNAIALQAHADALQAELTAEPTRGDLVQKVLDAQAAAVDAAKAAAANAESLV
jgi:hypothetical protein